MALGSDLLGGIVVEASVPGDYEQTPQGVLLWLRDTKVVAPAVLAAALGVSVASLKNWHQGRAIPPLLLWKLSAWLAAKGPALWESADILPKWARYSTPSETATRGVVQQSLGLGDELAMSVGASPAGVERARLLAIAQARAEKGEGSEEEARSCGMGMEYRAALACKGRKGDGRKDAPTVAPRAARKGTTGTAAPTDAKGKGGAVQGGGGAATKNTTSAGRKGVGVKRASKKASARGALASALKPGQTSKRGKGGK